jgi:hypothetical protein
MSYQALENIIAVVNDHWTKPKLLVSHSAEEKNGLLEASLCLKFADSDQEITLHVTGYIGKEKQILDNMAKDLLLGIFSAGVTKMNEYTSSLEKTIKGL